MGASSPTGSKLLVLFLVVTAVAGSGLCYWLYGGMNAAGTRYDARKAEVGDENAVRAKLMAAQRDLETARQTVRSLEPQMTEAWYVPTLLKQLEASAKACNLEIVSVRPQQQKQAPKPDKDADKDKDKDGKEQPKAKPEPKKPYQEMDIEVAVSGGFWDVLRFLKGIDTFPKILAVRQIQITPRGPTAINQHNNDAPLDAKLTVRAFVFSRSGTNNIVQPGGTNGQSAPRGTTQPSRASAGKEDAAHGG